MLVAHISDVHLGRKSPGDPHGADRLNSFRQAIATLAACKPDVIVIAGDTFDNPHIDQAVIEEAAKSFARAHNEERDYIPVVLIPGNHDPADADKLWTAFQTALPPAHGVRLTLMAEVINLAEGKLVVEAYPCPTRYSAQPPWEKRLPVAADGGAVRLVLAHGTLQGGPIPEGETDAYPFTQGDVEALGADYVALGHFHGLYPPWTGGDECQRGFCYSGTHEPDQFGSDAGYVILASVVKGQPTRLRRLKVGKRQWCLLNIIRPADLARVDDLRTEVEASNDPGRFVIRLKVATGTGWRAGEIEQLDRLESGLRAVGAHVERRGEAHIKVDVNSLDLAGLPSGAIKEALLSLSKDLEQSGDDNRREILAAAIQVGWEKLQEAGTP